MYEHRYKTFKIYDYKFRLIKEVFSKKSVEMNGQYVLNGATYSSVTNNGSQQQYVATMGHNNNGGTWPIRPVYTGVPQQQQQRGPPPPPQQQRGLPPVVFFKNRDAVGYIEPAEWNDKGLKNEEVYKQLCKTIRQEHIQGVQKIGGLWRLYLTDTGARCKLLTQGLDIRGKTVTVYEHNPFLRTATNTVIVRVCDVPLSVHDSEIVTSLRSFGAEIKGECTKEKLRVGGQLVNCLTGNRRIEIRTPKEPLPRFISVNDFKARVYHPGQPQTKDITCSRCQEKGHHLHNCKNKTFKCSECKEEGHLRYACPILRAKQTAESNTQHEEEVQTQLSPSIIISEPNKSSDHPSTKGNNISNTAKKTKSQSVLKLKAGKFELTRNPNCDRDSSVSRGENDHLGEEADTEYFSNNDSSNGDISSEHESDSHEHEENAQYSSMSAKSPSPNNQGKRKQKDVKQRRRRSKTSKGKKN